VGFLSPHCNAFLRDQPPTMLRVETVSALLALENLRNLSLKRSINRCVRNTAVSTGNGMLTNIYFNNNNINTNNNNTNTNNTTTTTNTTTNNINNNNTSITNNICRMVYKITYYNKIPRYNKYTNTLAGVCIYCRVLGV